jgi:hypothetical protein
VKGAYTLLASPLISPKSHVTLAPTTILDLCDKHSFNSVSSCIKMLHVRYTLELEVMVNTCKVVLVLN